jgi:hypothetical protein
LPPRATRQAARANLDCDGFLSVPTFPEFQGPWCIPTKVAHALDVLAVNVDLIERVVAKVRQWRCWFTDGPKAVRFDVVGV